MISRSDMNKMAAQINNLAYAGKYKEAAQIADEIQWTRVKDIKLLKTVSDVYEKCERYHDAKRVLTIVYNRVEASKRLVYKLSELSAKAGDMADAKEFYWEFREIAPNDAGKLILAYYIMCAENEDDAKKMEVLELYLREDFDEVWAYTLAQLYYKAEQTEECVKICDEIILWYSGSEYGVSALRLKHKCLGIEDEEQLENRIEIISVDKKDEAEVVAEDKEELMTENFDASDLDKAEIETTDNSAVELIDIRREVTEAQVTEAQVTEAQVTDNQVLEPAGVPEELVIKEAIATPEELVIKEETVTFDSVKRAGDNFIILEKATDREKVFVFGRSEAVEKETEEIEAAESETDKPDVISKVLEEAALTAEMIDEENEDSDSRVKVLGYIDGSNNFTPINEADAIAEDMPVPEKKTGSKNIVEHSASDNKKTRMLKNSFKKNGEIKIYLIECSQMRGSVKYAVNKLHYIHKQSGIKMTGAAKISDAKFSARGAADSISVLKGRDLIIEGVNEITYEVINELMGMMADETKPVILAIVDTPAKLALFVNRHRSFAEKCEYIYEEASISRTEFINYINNYAYKLNAVLDDTADEELDYIADEMIEDSLAFTISEAAEIVDRAIEKAKKPGIRGIFEAKKDADGYFILRSRHFDRG